MIDELLIDRASNSLPTLMSRVISSCGSFAAVIGLAVLADSSERAESIRIGMTISDFGIRVIPKMVPESGRDTAIALAAKNATLTAVQLIHFFSMLA